MRYWLHLQGSDLLPGMSPLTSAQIGENDEVLCGACQALLSIDHSIWVNAGPGDSPGVTDGTLSCALCGAVNDTSWAVTTDPRAR